MPSVLKMIPTDSQCGIMLEYLVTKPSKNPAENVNGKVLIKIFIPVIAPCLKEVYLECVPGNKILAPRIKPAAASITIANISMEP